MLAFFRSKTTSNCLAWIVIIAFLNLLDGCYYYKVTPRIRPDISTLPELLEKDKRFIVHSPDTVWQFSNISIEENNLKGRISEWTDMETYLTTIPYSKNRYKNRDRDSTLDQVHLFASSFSFLSDSTVAVPDTAISKIEIYDPATGATVASFVFGVVGVASLAVVTFAVIATLLKESCPFIYVFNGESLKFIGEIYSGAIYPTLERHDYLPLPDMKTDSAGYRIKMTNEVREIQNTNLIELLVFNHPEETEVLVDKYGEYQTISKLHSLVTATNILGNDIREKLLMKDSLSYYYDDQEESTNPAETIILDFDRAENVNNAKLVINAKNTFWLDHVISEFHGLFGEEYDCWVDKQADIPEKKMRDWLIDQKIPLSVYVDDNGKWKLIDYYNVIGPMAFKQDIMSFNLPEEVGESLRIKLEYGYLFWDIDYVGIDYSKNLEINQKTAKLIDAVDNNGNDVKELVSFDDNLYYIQPEIGDEVVMNFQIPDPEGGKQSLILHSKGYYQIIIDSKGEEQRRALLSFRKKGRMAEFSRELFQNLRTN